MSQIKMMSNFTIHIIQENAISLLGTCVFFFFFNFFFNNIVHFHYMYMCIKVNGAHIGESTSNDTDLKYPQSCDSTKVGFYFYYIFAQLLLFL